MGKFAEYGWNALRWAYAFWFFTGSFVVLSHQWTGRPAFPRVKPAAQALLDAFHASQFLYPLAAIAFLVGGAALFRRSSAPLGLVILAGPTAVIVVFHLAASGKPLWGAFVGIAFLLLTWRERRRFEDLWRSPASS